MKLFITSSFESGKNREEIENLYCLVQKAGFKAFSFIRDVENYQKIFDDPHELMKRAKLEISLSDALLIDMTGKPTGRAIEAGIAFSQDKKIIVIMKKGVIIKDTVKGIANEIIEYENIEDIVEPMKELVLKWH